MTMAWMVKAIWTTRACLSKAIRLSLHRMETVAEYVRRIASIGGKARAKKLSKKRQVEIATKASKARWKRYRERQARNSEQ